ncbi:hypothetical protein EV283_1044 [Sphingomonas sp. BK036]|uniref:hypothetical protein n=1 Tax=Sphingomonas sp. BK036 TaxID=2512122 RepID=UPI001029C25B|nr:hypothetical protein [Sphingomonas sp. BK036]RZT56987.1 hypothetical protein EV283_1044 [Sphingomonas sp. BK036]
MLTPHPAPKPSVLIFSASPAETRAQALSCQGTVDYITALVGAVRLTLDELHGDVPAARKSFNQAMSLLNLLDNQAAAALATLENIKISARSEMVQ